MTIKLGETVLCAGQERNSTGSPVGPDGLQIEVQPGVESRQFVGADRVEGEWVKCDTGVLTFSVSRTFNSVAAALAWIADTSANGFIGEAREGVLTFDGVKVFGDKKSVVRNRRVAHVGCTVAVNYTIEG